MNYLRQVLAIVEKDIVREIRTKEMFSSMFVFVLLVFVIFNFAFGENQGENLASLLPGILWVAFLFAATLGLNRAFIHEKDEDCLDGLMLCPVDFTAIYFGKAIGNLIFLFIVEAIAIPVSFIFFSGVGRVANFWLFLAIIILGNIGITAIGTLLSAISINTRARDLMMPILFFPVIIPILIAAAKSTTIILSLKPDISQVYPWLWLLVLYDIIFLLVSFAVFEYVLEER